MLAVHNLQKTYIQAENPTPALQGITFSVDKGEFVSIMGPSGSGKSTLLNILSFLDRPTGGTYTFEGKSIDDMDDRALAHVRNQDMGFVFQSFNLLARLTVYENVEIPLLYSQVPVAERRERIEEAVRSVGLPEKLFVEAGRLSGGQKQRVAIARALVTDPAIIFADEPTGNLDSKSGAQVLEILESLNQKGRTIILVTHETSTAEFASRIIHLTDGKIDSDRPVSKAAHEHRHFQK